MQSFMLCLLIAVLKIFETFNFCLSLVVELIFQNALHMALYNKTDINVKAGVFFKFIQKLPSNTLLCITRLKMQLIFYLMYTLL
jgi:hypothetical protein